MCVVDGWFKQPYLAPVVHDFWSCTTCTVAVGIFWHLTIRFDYDSEVNDSILNRLSMHLDATIFVDEMCGYGNIGHRGN